MVKNLTETQETGVQSLGQEDPLEEGTAPHTPVFLPKEPHGQRSQTCEGHTPWCRKKSDITERLSTQAHSSLNVMLEKTLESLLNSKEIKPVIPKGNQP